jgi:hypothetical protein
MVTFSRYPEQLPDFARCLRVRRRDPVEQALVEFASSAPQSLAGKPLGCGTKHAQEPQRRTRKYEKR